MIPEFYVKGRECTTVYRTFNNTQDQKTNEIVLGGLKKPIDDYVRTHSRLINDVAPMMPFFGYNVQKYIPVINHTVRTMATCFEGCFI